MLNVAVYLLFHPLSPPLFPPKSNFGGINQMSLLVHASKTVFDAIKNSKGVFDWVHFIIFSPLRYIIKNLEHFSLNYIESQILNIFYFTFNIFIPCLIKMNLYDRVFFFWLELYGSRINEYHSFLQNTWDK